jgi:DNA-binding GntR family transcriptional regulator
MPRPSQSGPASLLSPRLGPSQQGTPEAGLADAAYAAIKEAIRSNRFEPGYHAGEVEIARQLGMSRTPVHQAMARLQEEGLVRIQPKRGILICGLSPAELADAYEIVVALEGAAAERLAGQPAGSRGATADTLAALTDAMEAALQDNDLTEWAAADEKFHETLVAACGNARLQRMAGTIEDQLHRARMFTLKLRPLPVDSAGQHRAIVDALRAGDTTAAREAAAGHRRSACAAILPLVRKLGLSRL